MFSDGNIELFNKDGNFNLKGPNSLLRSDEIDINGENINGKKNSFLAINELSLLRQSKQTAFLNLRINENILVKN